MRDLLGSIKADLASRKMAPLTVLVCAAVLAAIVYAVIGGSSRSPVAASTVRQPTVTIPPVQGPAVSDAPADPDSALAETTSGATYQHHGRLRDPFMHPGGESGSQSGESSGSGGSESEASQAEGGGSEGSGSSSEGSGPASFGSEVPGGEGTSGAGGEGSPGFEGGASGGTPSSGGSKGPNGGGGKNSNSNGSSNGQHAGEGFVKPGGESQEPHPEVTFQLQRLTPEGKPLGQKRTFADVRRPRPLPSKKKPLIAFLGIGNKHGGAVFLLVRPAIVQGEGKCLPSPANCEGIELLKGESEELQYMERDGSSLTYELTVKKVAMVLQKATAKSSSSASGTQAGKPVGRGSARADAARNAQRRSVRRARWVSELVLAHARAAAGWEAAVRIGKAVGTEQRGQRGRLQAPPALRRLLAR